MKGVTILGSTGSIGVSTLSVLSENRDRFRVVALTANSDCDGLFRQCLEHQPDFAVLVEAAGVPRLEQLLHESGLKTEVLVGSEALEAVAALPEVDHVMAAIVGAAGLLPTLAAARAGKRVLLANKESLVMAGRLFMDEVQRNGAELIPIDSEHNAVFQCMPPAYRPGRRPDGVRRILLTASGGPFRGWLPERLAEVTPAEACAHPNWVMGRKISVDSATMMNKGLEVIEACWLFNVSVDEVEVVVHPQSVIHSLVEYLDGSVLAQLGHPDMRTPIANGLAWPERVRAGVDSLDLFDIGHLDFEEPDLEAFPCLGLALRAAQAGGNAPLVLNAANEIAVAAFLAERLPFTGIAEVVGATLDQCAGEPLEGLEHILAQDTAARETARGIIAARASGAI